MGNGLYYLYNSCLYIQTKQSAVLIDGVFKPVGNGMSLMDESLVEELKMKSGMFQRLDAFVFTHSHSDHYDCELLQELTDGDNEIPIYCPGEDCSDFICTRISEHIELAKIEDIKLYFFDSVHENELFKNDVHKVILLVADNKRILILGDAILTLELADEILSVCSGYLDFIFINPSQALMKTTPDFFKKFRKGQIMVYHLPLKKDDIYSYHLMAALAKEKLESERIFISICPFYEWIYQEEEN